MIIRQWFMEGLDVYYKAALVENVVTYGEGPTHDITDHDIHRALEQGVLVHRHDSNTKLVMILLAMEDFWPQWLDWYLAPERMTTPGRMLRG